MDKVERIMGVRIEWRAKRWKWGASEYTVFIFLSFQWNEHFTQSKKKKWNQKGKKEKREIGNEMKQTSVLWQSNWEHNHIGNNYFKTF